jgi:hypothetical protein
MIYARDFFAPAEEIESQWSECFLPESDSIMLDHAISQSEVAELSSNEKGSYSLEVEVWGKVLIYQFNCRVLKQN